MPWRVADRVSRILDFVIAAGGLVVFAPLMMLIAVAVLIESSGPVFFAQTRLGLRGRHFRIYKFRKFHNDIGKTGCPLTVKNDARLSRVGRFLARTKLDELPQLYNVLKGDMAIVGPRPESLDFADCFTGSRRKILDYKPGIFGPSQVAFRDECSFFPVDADPTRFYREVLFPLKAGADLSYYPNRTLSSDLKWIIRGVLAIAGWERGVATALADLRMTWISTGASTGLQQQRPRRGRPALLEAQIPWTKRGDR
jgi:lipopolysaccharide/colanic/teichoic acid biosynthesis glycosyltransferase